MKRHGADFPMDDPRDDLDERFADWVDGRLAPAEVARLEAELEADDDLRQRADRYRSTVALLHQHLAEDYPIDVTRAVMARVAPPRRRLFPILASVAAAAAIVALTVILYRLTDGRNAFQPDAGVVRNDALDETAVDSFANGRAPRPRPSLELPDAVRRVAPPAQGSGELGKLRAGDAGAVDKAPSAETVPADPSAKTAEEEREKADGGGPVDMRGGGAAQSTPAKATPAKGAAPAPVGAKDEARKGEMDRALRAEEKQDTVGGAGRPTGDPKAPNEVAPGGTADRETARPDPSPAPAAPPSRDPSATGGATPAGTPVRAPGVRGGFGQPETKSRAAPQMVQEQLKMQRPASVPSELLTEYARILREVATIEEVLRRPVRPAEPSANSGEGRQAPDDGKPAGPVAKRDDRRDIGRGAGGRRRAVVGGEVVAVADTPVLLIEVPASPPEADGKAAKKARTRAASPAGQRAPRLDEFANSRVGFSSSNTVPPEPVALGAMLSRLAPPEKGKAADEPGTTETTVIYRWTAGDEAYLVQGDSEQIRGFFVTLRDYLFTQTAASHLRPGRSAGKKGEYVKEQSATAAGSRLPMHMQRLGSELRVPGSLGGGGGAWRAHVPGRMSFILVLRRAE